MPRHGLAYKRQMRARRRTRAKSRRWLSQRWLDCRSLKTVKTDHSKRRKRLIWGEKGISAFGERSRRRSRAPTPALCAGEALTECQRASGLWAPGSNNGGRSRRPEPRAQAGWKGSADLGPYVFLPRGAGAVIALPPARGTFGRCLRRRASALGLPAAAIAAATAAGPRVPAGELPPRRAENVEGSAGAPGASRG